MPLFTRTGKLDKGDRPPATSWWRQFLGRPFGGWVSMSYLRGPMIDRTHARERLKEEFSPPHVDPASQLPASDLPDAVEHDAQRDLARKWRDE
jgi:hypothetical protein